MKAVGYLYFHFGWTDIINSLALINYYAPKYEKIILFMRAEAKNLVDFYIKQVPNCEVIYVKAIGPREILEDKRVWAHLHRSSDDCDYLFHGEFDWIRRDKYSGLFFHNDRQLHFVAAFYKLYDIDFFTRINEFKVERDFELEQRTLEKFQRTYGQQYIIYHEVIHGPQHNDITYVNLNCISDVFFDYISVIEGALEIHLLDSCWAALIYHLDCKWRLFANKNIYVVCKRNHHPIFSDPIKLDNWFLI